VAIEPVLETQAFDAGMEALALLPVRFPLAAVAFVQALEAAGLVDAALGGLNQIQGLVELLQLQAFELLQHRAPVAWAWRPRPCSHGPEGRSQQPPGQGLAQAPDQALVPSGPPRGLVLLPKPWGRHR
jgi:hypothetical protein